VDTAHETSRVCELQEWTGYRWAVKYVSHPSQKGCSREGSAKFGLWRWTRVETCRALKKSPSQKLEHVFHLSCS
jgi:hypothetical protein